MPKTINFICSEDNNRVSGGYIYNHKFLNGLENKGYAISHYHAKTIELMQPADHTIVDSIAVNDCAPHLLDLPSEPILLCHLPPEMQVKKIAGDSLKELTAVETLISRSHVLSTGTSCSDYMRDHYGLDESQMHLIMPGLLDNWKTKKQFSALPQKLIVVANLIPNTGYEMLVTVLAKLKHFDWSLQIFGDDRFSPDYSHSVLESINHNGLKNKVTYSGVVNQNSLNNVMTKSDLLIQLSPFEPYSMVSLEAIYSNLPMLSSISGEYGEFDRSGLVRYLPELTVDCCLENLETLLTEPNEYAKLCKKPKLKKRDWFQVVEEFEQLLEAI